MDRTTLLRQQLVDMLRTSTMLTRALPRPRQLALIESGRAAASVQAIKAIVIDNTCGSPFLPDDQKDGLVELVLAEQWDALRKALRCPASATLFAADPHPLQRFAEFRQMVVSIFIRSKKIQSLPPQRRQQLGSAIHRAPNKEQLLAVAFGALVNAQTLDAAGREHVANDILDGRFDRLLLPDRLDCDERPRQHVSSAGNGAAEEEEEEDECPICLGVSQAQHALPCGHKFCQACIKDWAASNLRAGRFTCPCCRASTPAAASRASTSTSTMVFTARRD